MDWSGILGLGGLALGGLTIFLTYRERTSGYRHALYERQVNAVAELLPALNDVEQAASRYILIAGGRLTEETRNGMRDATAGQWQSFYVALKKQAVVLPQDFLDTVSRFQLVFDALSVAPDVAHLYEDELVKSKDPGLDLSNAYVDVVRAGRRVIGTEPLSAQTSRLFGKDPTGEQGKRETGKRSKS